jgi:carboxylesterase type B
VTAAYRTFGNIPFAAPPVGENRWRDPQPVTPWRGVWDATGSSPVCAQVAQLGEPRPVMVWIHGGGFSNGAAIQYDARAFAAKTDALAAVYGQDGAGRVAQRYPVNGDGDARDELAAVLTDDSWACPTHDTRRQLGSRARVSGYEFAQPDVPVIFPDLPPFPGGYRACHASELPLLFDFGVKLTPEQRELSDYTVSAWGRFARTGDPGWRAPVQSLAAGAVGPTDFVKDHNCDFWGAM